MSERNFSMRLRSMYEGDTNAVTSLEVEHKVEEQWRPLDLGLASPGFDIFVYAIFTCQHMYFRVNCAERSLMLKNADGSLIIGTDQNWNIETLQVHFSGRIGSGQASPDDINYIVSRMKQCPVSLNMREISDAKSTITLN